VFDRGKLWAGHYPGLSGSALLRYHLLFLFSSIFFLSISSSKAIPQAVYFYGGLVIL
jgi:hypothetical protein